MCYPGKTFVLYEIILAGDESRNVMEGQAL